tara:strand:+ start:187 stop:399 length:213 start_codon:yes stop_codon:yes gene_type:complete
MENIDKIIRKLEDQISFMQRETSQMSEEIYTQQKEISNLRIELTHLKNKFNDIDKNNLSNLDEELQPPHY